MCIINNFQPKAHSTFHVYHITGNFRQGNFSPNSPLGLGGKNLTIEILHELNLIIESVDSISRDEPDSPLTQYITNAGISRARYTIMHFKHHHRVLRLISNRISV